MNTNLMCHKHEIDLLFYWFGLKVIKDLASKNELIKLWGRPHMSWNQQTFFSELSQYI
uniref:Uncharacterized protein n=1 Tax=Helianthus annuus TaxID=4232 RepID=A0A251TP75_HELAN